MIFSIFFCAAAVLNLDGSTTPNVEITISQERCKCKDEVREDVKIFYLKIFLKSLGRGHNINGTVFYQ